MRRIGADLHDGPAQDLAYAALRLDSLSGALEGHATGPDIARVRDAITQAMGEVRALSRGLSLPQIAGKSLPSILAQACEAHEVRTGHAVAFHSAGDAPQDTGDPLRIAAFRFVQEGLNNASRHGNGADLAVDLRMEGPRLTLTVADRGPGLPDAAQLAAPSRPSRAGLGLNGLRDRVESLGGTFVARNRAGGGTELIMTLDTGRTA
jgi:signal transduction histidine kinase